MSERIGELNFYGEGVDLTVENTSLFTHATEPHIDHVYVILPERYDTEAGKQALYLWRALGHTAAAYALLAPEIEQTEGAEVHKNIRSASAVDRESYAEAALRHGGSWDTLPEDWA